MIIVLGGSRSLLDRSRRGSRLDILLRSRSKVHRSRSMVYRSRSMVHRSRSMMDRRGSRSRLNIPLVSSRFSYRHNLPLGSRGSLKSRSSGCCGSNT